MKKRLFLQLLILGIAQIGIAASWQPAKGPLMTPWADDAAPENVWPEYPRPQMVRDSWQNLNGLWDYAERCLKTDELGWSNPGAILRRVGS
jgi:hypothetical protein